MGKLKNDKNQELVSEKAEMKKPRNKANLENIQNRITILTNEVAILECTIKIYDATYEKPWHTDVHDLEGLWGQLNGTFQSDNMKNLLGYLWKNLHADADHKLKAGKAL